MNRPARPATRSAPDTGSGTQGSTRRRAGAVLAAILLLVTLAAACAAAPTPAAIPAVPAGSLARQVSLKGMSYRVGGKEFDEQRVLCQIEVATLSSVGADVVDDCGLVGTDTARAALVDGSIDTYIEYTGTGWLEHLKEPDQTRDPAEQYRLVRAADLANGLVWLPPAPMDNTYAIALTRSNASRLGLRTLSDFARYTNTNGATLCVESEFAGRPDGLPGMLTKYGVTKKPSTTIEDVNATYGSIANSNPCIFGEVYSTDGRIADLNLTVLTDDRAYFPRYNPAPVVRKTVYDHAPQIEAALAPVMAQLDDTTMLELNREVSADGRDPSDVARQWLARRGFIGSEQ